MVANWLPTGITDCSQWQGGLMAKRGEITKRSVDAMKPKVTKDVFLWDGKLSGFGVRCRPSTERYYFIKMRAGKRQRWITIGKHGAPWTAETARSEALRLLGKREDGRDPGAERDTLKENPTVDELAAEFLEQHIDAKRKPSTAKEYRRLFDKLVSPKLGKTQACSIARSDVARLHHSLRTTPYQANRVLAMMSKLFTWADLNGIKVNGNPAKGIERYTEDKRKLFLNAEQLTKIGAAMREMEKAEKLEPQEAAAIRLLLFTGCRLREILTLKWEYVDKTNAQFRLPDSKTGAKIVPLSAPALVVLSTLPRLKSNPFVIPSPRLKGKPLVNLEKPWLAVRKKAGLEQTRLHDLRHAYGSMGAGVGFGLPIIGALLGHTQASTTQRYAHVQTDPMKAAADAIASRLQEALDKEPTQEGAAS
jgi:integrase